VKFGQIIRILQRINSLLLDVADEGKGARLRNLIKDPAADTGLSLKGADFAGANLSGVTLVKADLRKANLEEASLKNADLSYTNLEDTNLRWANLQKANLKHANLKRVDLRGADVSGADLSYTNLRNANLTESIVAVHYPDVGTLYEDFLVRIRISGTRFDKNTRWPDNFDPIKAGAICEDL